VKYRKKPVVIEAMTFDDLVAYGKANGGNIVNGMPWSFTLNTTSVDDEGNRLEHQHYITHENDDCYLIPTLEGTHNFKRGDMLITGVKGEIYPCRRDIFEATYEPVEQQPPASDVCECGHGLESHSRCGSCLDCDCPEFRPAKETQ
jgi:hypothetical protein